MRGLQGLVALAIDVPAPNFRFGVLRRVANRTTKTTLLPKWLRPRRNCDCVPPQVRCPSNRALPTERCQSQSWCEGGERTGVERGQMRTSLASLALPRAPAQHAHLNRVAWNRPPAVADNLGGTGVG